MPKKVLVTGASRGIGYAAARAFAEKGYTVFAVYNKTKDTLPALSEQLSENGFKLIPVQCDVSDSSDVSRMFDRVGDIDVLINSAGISKFSMLCDVSEADWDEMLGTNLKSVYLCSKLASRGMVRKKSGSIINISSIWGVVGASCESAYSASKAGIIGFTRALAKELGPSGITVNCIAPGVIDTDMNKPLSDEDMSVLISETPLGRIGKPEDVASAALFLAEADFITGEVLNVGGGFGL